MNHHFIPICISIATILLIISGQFAESGAISNKFSRLLKNSPLLSCFVDKKHESEYEKIDAYLVDHVGTDHAFANLDGAKNWLNQRRSSIGSKVSRSDQSLNDALEEFIELLEIIADGPKKCLRKSAEILANNDRSTRFAIDRIQAGKQDIRRIDRIVHAAATLHAKDCPATYVQQLEVIDSKIPATLKSRTEQFAHLIVTSRLLASEPEKFSDPKKTPAKKLLLEVTEYIDNNPVEAAAFVEEKLSHLGEMQDADLMFQTLDRFTNEDKLFSKAMALHKTDKDGDINEDGIVDLFNKYLVTNCQDYINWMDGVLLPLKFDMKISDNLFNGDDGHELLDTLFASEFCRKFLEHKKDAQKSLLKYARTILY